MHGQVHKYTQHPHDAHDSGRIYLCVYTAYKTAHFVRICTPIGATAAATTCCRELMSINQATTTKYAPGTVPTSASARWSSALKLKPNKLESSTMYSTVDALATNEMGFTAAAAGVTTLSPATLLAW